jgi:hypothetical protein
MHHPPSLLTHDVLLLQTGCDELGLAEVQQLATVDEAGMEELKAEVKNPTDLCIIVY